jgi:hypothetical protein
VRRPALLVGGAHAFGVVHAERHGLFLVDVFAGVERRYEVLAMQMLRRGDQHGVDGFVVQQVAVIEVRLGVRARWPARLPGGGVDVGDARDFGVRAGHASRMICAPRSPGPMMPRRMRSLAASTLGAAMAPAKPLATLPMKIRRDCMETPSKAHVTRRQTGGWC